MFFQNSMKKILAERGYRHCANDEEFTRHGDYARNIQYAFSKEFTAEHHAKIVDVIFLSVDLHDEKLVIGLFRENCSIENGIIENSHVSIPLAKFSLEEFEKQLDRLIPRGSPSHRQGDMKEKF